MTTARNVLITGGAGYIGSVLTGEFLRRGWTVRALDVLWFDTTSPMAYWHNPGYEFVRGDIRDDKCVRDCLNGVDYVIHTAAVVGEPAAVKFPVVTDEVNTLAARNLAQACTRAHVRGFVFFSTCSNYGIAGGTATETSPLNPLCPYSRSKVGMEQYLQNVCSDLPWLILRLSTVCGASPRMRFDLTVNDFTLNAYRNGRLDVFNPNSFRPYIHVYDLAMVVTALVDRFNEVSRQVFNVGFNGENYRKIDVVNAIRERLPNVRVNIVTKADDRRDYYVDFTKLERLLHMQPVRAVRGAVSDILAMLRAGIIADVDNPAFYNTTPRAVLATTATGGHAP
jgi:nucleoside-diphosphate-sugar epimerase